MFLRVIAGVLSLFFLSARAADAATETAYGKPGKASAVTRTVTVEAKEFSFGLDKLTVKRGETIKFVLVNKGSEDHELTIGDAAMEAEHIEAMAKAAKGKGHGGHDHDHAMHGNSVTAAPGKSGSLVWTFSRPGSFVFFCGYPGHAELGQRGTITVE